MAVTPMDLQVLFMQEPAAAKESEKKRRAKEARQTRLGNLSRYRSHNPTVQSTEDSAAPAEIDDEGGGNQGRYRGGGAGEDEEEEKERPSEEGKGDVVDFEA